MKTATNRFAELHWPLIMVTVTIAILGVYNLSSAAAARDGSLYITQLLWMLVGIGIVGALLAVDYRVTESMAYVVYGLVCLLLLAVLLQGYSAGGARRWLVVGPVRFQPSELAKLATVLCLARYYGHRVKAGGYSLSALLRPFNPSRPVAVLVALAIFWSSPWMADPVGQLARLIREKSTAAPVVGDLLWFRLSLVGFIVVGLVVSVIVIFRLEERFALLNPWPQGRRRRLILTAIGTALLAGLGLFLKWDAPFIRDPVGEILSSLYMLAAPGGPAATLTEGMGLRVFLLLLSVSYAGASMFMLRRGVVEPIDILVAPIDLLALPALLVLVEPDLGTAGIIILVGMTMILVVGVKVRSLIVMGVLGAMMAAVSWFGVLKDYQRRRILTFIDPEHDIQGAGWNAVQSMIAVGSGQWWGKGHRGGTQTQLSFLPEQHTDFAFSVWAEEQGFVGCLVVLLLYFFLLLFAFNVARNARETYGSLLAVGVAAIILWQAVINVSMVIGSFPVVGLTLPLFSYGGSSVVTVLLGLGLLLNIHWRRRAH